MVYYSALHWAKKAEKSAEHVEEIKKELDMSGLDLTTYAKDAKVVHNTGDETIDGIKTFTNIPYINTGGFREIANIDKGTKPSSTVYGFSNTLYDKNGTKQANKLGQNYIQVDTNGGIANSMEVFKPISGSSESSRIKVGYDSNGNVYTEAPIPTDTTTTSGRQIATTGWCNDATKSTNIVHKTGDETIDGIKTFNNTVLSYNPINAFNSLNKNITRGTAPTSKQEGFLTITSDKYNINLAGIYYTHTIENRNSLSMLVYDPTKSSGYDQAYLRLGYGGVGAYAETVKPVNNGSQSSTNIATVGWVNDPSASLNVVHRTGDETIKGGKRFESSLGDLSVRFTGSDSMTAPSSARYNTAIRCEDKNGKNTGNFRNVFSTNGNITTDMQVCRQINGTSKYADMGVRMSNTGVVSTFAPTPPTGDNSTQIATTEWYNNKHKVVSALPSSPTAGVFYYITE